MATNLSRTLEAGHDADYDYSCTPCADSKLNAEALFYCRNCSQLFCDTCVKYHDKFTKGHQVMGKAEVARWGKVKAVTPAVMCEKHPDKEEEMYCADHDLVCCNICIKLHLGSCKRVQHVSEVATGIQQTLGFQSFLQEAASTQTSLRDLQDRLANNAELLQKTRDEIVASIKDIRESFNQFIDMLEKESTKEMDRLLSILQEKVQGDIDSCSESAETIQELLDDIKSQGTRCEEFVFQCFNKCKQRLLTAEHLLASMADEDYQLKFTPYIQIQEFLSSLETFGKFDLTPKDLDPDYVYTAARKQFHDVRTRKDTQNCSISAICQLSNGQVAAVDNQNKKVKLLSSTRYIVTDELDLPPSPYDICTTTGTEMVVTVLSVSDNSTTNSELHFINADGPLATKRTVQLDHQCFAIACHNDQLYVGSKTSIYEYSLSGQKMKTIYEDTSSQGITVFRLAVCDNGNLIYITNFQQSHLLTVDQSGQQLSVFTDQELQKPTGVCLTDKSTVFVSGFSSHKILQVDKECKNLAIVAKQSDGVFNPLSLCYDRNLKHLLIGQRNNDNLLVLQLA